MLEDLNVLSISSAAMGVTSEAVTGTTVSGERIGASMMFKTYCEEYEAESCRMLLLMPLNFFIDRYQGSRRSWPIASGVGCSYRPLPSVFMVPLPMPSFMTNH